MSLSDEDKRPEQETPSDAEHLSDRGDAWGTIFTPSGEQTLGGVERARSTAWTEADEQAYLERVRQKAGEAAAGIVAEARAEAARLREEARKQGYEAGLGEAEHELEAFRSGMTESVQAVLSAIEGQCSHIFDQWRGELINLVRRAVEKVTCIEMDERRAESLAALLGEAVAELEKRRELVIRVNPEDEPAINDIVTTTRERFADVKSWRVKADATINPGGLVVESEASLAEGRMESRLAAVDAILSRLTLPEHPEGGPA